MDPFMRSDQFNFIKSQAQILVKSHASVNDKKVLHALKTLAADKIYELFSNRLNENQKRLLERIMEVEDGVKAEKFLEAVKEYVIPFKKVSEQTVKKLFPKAKKLKLPSFMENQDYKEISYLGWEDTGTSKKYLIALYQNDFVGLHGTFTPSQKKGICTICSRHAEVGLFMSETKGAVQGTFTKRGNYICRDSLKCNENMISLQKLEEFIILLKGFKESN